MTTTPESSSFDTQSGRTADFDMGLAAFKAAEYATAIVLLEPALTESPRQPLIARAQMALAIAYEKMGETQRAAQLCQVLQAEGTPLVQDWATRTLAALVKQYPELRHLQPKAPTPNPIPTAQPSATDPSEMTGFTPLGAATLPPVVDHNWAPPPVAPIAPAPETSHPKQPSSGKQQPQTNTRTSSPAAQPLPDPVDFYQPHWRQAGRAKQWKSLGKVNLLKLGITQLATAIAMYFAVQQVLFWVVTSYGSAIIKTLPRLGFRIIQPDIPNWTHPLTLITLLVLFIGSRWILDGLLGMVHGLKPFSMQELSIYSPEAAESLPRFCRKANLPVPALGILPTSTPLLMSYGVLPQVTRVVISQGLLDHLSDDEIAALYASEIGHLTQWTVPLMSGITTLLQLPYLLYWQVSAWGNQKDSPITKASATLIAMFSYGLFWLWRWVPLWLSRQRIYYSDRVAADLTGNPNGYTRALLKLAIATANDVQKQKQASDLLEGFELLSPLGYRMAAPLGSLYAYTPLEPILEWDRTQPFRHWLAINNTHPPTGDRLNLLTLYARHWKLETELTWSEASTRRRKPTAFTGAEWRSLLLQGAPYWGVVFGVAIALGLKLVGIIGERFRWDWASWMGPDTTILLGLPLVCLCIGILIRLNPFFPDLPTEGRKKGHQETVIPLLTDPTTTPLRSQPVRLEGTILGRRGISNVFNQDLWLNTAKGLIPLHYTSRLGVFGSLFPQVFRPSILVNKALLVTGWFRRSTIPWLDVDTLQTPTGRIEPSGHPVWSFVLAAIAATWGILILFNVKL
jgi:Zn-dependent protease with chaperone function